MWLGDILHGVPHVSYHPPTMVRCSHLPCAISCLLCGCHHHRDHTLLGIPGLGPISIGQQEADPPRQMGWAEENCRIANGENADKCD